MDAIHLPDLRGQRDDHASDDMLLEEASRPMALKFQVSPEAMRIRLEGMGFLLRKDEASLFDG
jgi:hypothetical protein